MRKRILSLVLAFALLLCACQTGAADNDASSPSPETVDPESPASPTPESPPPSESPAETGSDVRPEGYELAFTETDSFPMPFDGELYVNEYGELFLSTNEALYDYDTMWLLLEENFPYLDRIEAEMGIDWRAVRDSYRMILKRTALAMDGYLTQERFIGVIDKCLSEFNQVGHLYLIRPNRWQEWGDMWLSFEDGTLHHALGELIRNPRSEQFYEHWEKLLEVNTQKHSKRHWLNGEALPGLSFGRLDGDIPFIQSDTFSASVWTDDTYTALQRFLSTIGDEEHLIVNIADNSGGDFGPWMSLVASLIDEPLACDMFLAGKMGSLNLALNPYFGDPTGTVYKDDSWQEDFPYVQPESVDGMDLLYKMTRYVEPVDIGIDFQGKVWLLVSEYNYSSSDQFAVFCKDTGFATLVGTATGGNGIGAQPYVMALPYSGLVVYYEPYLSFNPDGTCNGISGTQPDIIPEDGQSALDACLAAIAAE